MLDPVSKNTVIDQELGTKHTKESQVGVGVFVADEVLVAGGLQVLVDDGDDALDLTRVSVLGRLDLLWMVSHEPDALAEVWTLARDLEVQPLLELPLLWRRSLGELVFLVVGLLKVLENSSGLQLGQPSSAVIVEMYCRIPPKE